MGISTCPMCGCPIRIARREDGAADHYEYIDEHERQHLPNPISPVLADYLRAKRAGKKTIAMVGSDWSSGPWAPFGEIEVWGMNQLHGRPWFKTEDVSAWIQIHPKWIFTKDNPHNHWEWLKKEHPFPIYMQMVYDNVPSSKKYPLREIQQKLINVDRGELSVNKLFSSSFCFQIALALYKGYERIEIYGVSLLGEGEYAYQREALAYWIGKADGMGVEIWLPESCALLAEPLYGYEVIRHGETGEIVEDESRIGSALPEMSIMQ